MKPRLYAACVNFLCLICGPVDDNSHVFSMEPTAAELKGGELQGLSDSCKLFCHQLRLVGEQVGHVAIKDFWSLTGTLLQSMLGMRHLAFVAMNHSEDIYQKHYNLQHRQDKELCAKRLQEMYGDSGGEGEEEREEEEEEEKESEEQGKRRREGAEKRTGPGQGKGKGPGKGKRKGEGALVVIQEVPFSPSGRGGPQLKL